MAGISYVFTISRVAEMLVEDDEWLMVATRRVDPAVTHHRTDNKLLNDCPRQDALPHARFTTQHRQHTTRKYPHVGLANSGSLMRSLAIGGSLPSSGPLSAVVILRHALAGLPIGEQERFLLSQHVANA